MIGFRHVMQAVAEVIANFKPSSYYVFSGTNLASGSNPTINGNYKDFEGDLEGTSIKKIYISDDKLGTNEVAQLSSYILQAGDIGKYIRFSYKPIALTGDLTGVEDFTPYRKIEDNLLLSAVTNTNGVFECNTISDLDFPLWDLSRNNGLTCNAKGKETFSSTADKTIKLFGKASKITYFEVTTGALKGALDFTKLTNLASAVVRLGTNSATANFSNCTLITSIIFAVNSSGLTALTLLNNPLLQTITLNGGNVALSTLDLSSFPAIKTLGFGFSNIRNLTLPTTPSAVTAINIKSTGMSQTQVNTFVDNELWAKKDLFNNSVAKTLDISGTNAAASGTYQAPAGFVAGVSDGTPASQQEKFYVMAVQQVSAGDTTKKYKWTFTKN